MKKFVSLLLAIGMLLSLAACGQSAASAGSQAAAASSAAKSGEPINIVVAHVYTGKSDEQKYLSSMKDEIEAKTNGAVTLTIYSDSTMGSEAEICSQIVSGVIDMGLSEGSAWADVVNVPGLGVFGLPYLYTSLDGMKNAGLNVVPDAANKLLEDNNVNLHAFVPFSGGLRNVWTVKKQIKTAADFKGMKMRTPEIKLFMDTLEAMGANATPVAWSDVYTALSQGVAEGCEIDAVSGLDMNFQEVVKYYTRTYHLGSLNILCMNKAKWDTIPAEYQQIITDAAMTAAGEQFDTRAANISVAEDKIAESGVEMYDLPADQLAILTENVKPIWEQYASDYGVGDIIDALSEAGSK